MTMEAAPRPDVHGETSAGRLRAENQDQFLIAELGRSMVVHESSLPLESRTRLSDARTAFLLLVADGLGGSPAGLRASRLAAEQVLRSVLGTMPWYLHLQDRGKELEEELKKVFERCELTLEADARENPSREGMATTLTMAYVVWPRLYVVHVGDARAYLLRDGRLSQLTTDHTVQAPGSESVPPRMVLWNVLGGKTSEVWPDVYTAQLEGGDVLLLSTDGLSRELNDAEIAEVLVMAADATQTAKMLVEKANLAGGRDNVTAVVARFGRREEAGTGEAHASAALATPAAEDGSEGEPTSASPLRES